MHRSRVSPLFEINMQASYWGPFVEAANLNGNVFGPIPDDIPKWVSDWIDAYICIFLKL